MQKNKKTKGSILAFALVVLSLMFAIAASLSLITTTEKKEAGSMDFSAQAYQAADSGVQTAVQKINSAILSPVNGTFSNGPATSINDSGLFPNYLSSTDPDILYPGGAKCSFQFMDGSGSIINNKTAPVSQIKSIKATGSFQGTVRAVSVSLN